MHFFCGISSSPATTDTSRCWPCGHQGCGLERAEPFKESCMNWLVKWDSLEAVIILNVDQLIGKYTVLQDYNAAVGLWWFMAVTIADISGLEWTGWLSCHLSFSMLKFGHDRQVLCHWALSSALWTSVLKHLFLTVQWKGGTHATAHAWRSEHSPVELVVSFHISVESGVIKLISLGFGDKCFYLPNPVFISVFAPLKLLFSVAYQLLSRFLYSRFDFPHY